MDEDAPLPPPPPPAAAAAAATAARKRALLLEARRQRLAWVQDEDYEEPEAPAAALLRSLEEDDGGAGDDGDDDALPHGWRRGRVSEVLGRVPGAAASSGGGATTTTLMPQLLPAAREYVAFLNRLAGEADVEVVQYPADLLLPKLPGDAELLGGEEGEEEGEASMTTTTMMPPLPDMAGEDEEELSYAAFVARLAHPLSSEVVQALQRFISAFVRRQRQRARQQQQQLQQSMQQQQPPLLDGRGGDGEMAEGLHAFIDGLRGEMRKSPAWAALVAPTTAPVPALSSGHQQQQQQQWEGVREHLEAFLVTKLHRYLFTPQERRALAARDAALRERLRGLAFLGPEHLDVRSVRRPLSLSVSVSVSVSVCMESIDFRALLGCRLVD